MPRSPLHDALRRNLQALPPKLLSSLALTPDSIIDSTPRTFSIYEPLLLLPAHAFVSTEWTTLLKGLDHLQKETFFTGLALSMKVTHIAINAPISQTLASMLHDEGNALKKANVQRRPNITPLYGDFGTFIEHEPSAEDFENAFWVSTRQNGITQVWAPIYTMFSRGNITEKARVLQMPSVYEAVNDAQGCTAVDLFAGIGYFAFSYAKAGCKSVLCFEINPWSIEGLRRGAKANRWSCSVTKSDQVNTDDDALLRIFALDNRKAADVIAQMRENLAAPIRHVNLGLLPTSSGAWDTAVKCLDPQLGGWLHVHENFAIKEIDAKAEDVRSQIEAIARETKGDNWCAVIDCVEKVKTYAPGVMHCVIDIHLYASS